MKYINGGYSVEIDEDTGTKTRTQISKAPPVQPETFDLKVTDWCNAGCSFCHEKSTIQGKHAELEPLLRTIEVLKPGTEIAIGGGDPLMWPHLDHFLSECKNKGFFCNLTVNGLHINKHLKRLIEYQNQNKIKGIGLSAITGNLSLGSFKLPYDPPLKNIVGHIILGRFSTYDLTYYPFKDYKGRQQYLNHYLILGYKKFGRGIDYIKQKKENYGYFDLSKEKLQKDVFVMMNWAKKNNVKLSFDNLALEQAAVQELVPEDIWNTHYMGEDGKFSMYIDAVEQTFAKTSTSPKKQRISWKEKDLITFFKELQ